MSLSKKAISIIAASVVAVGAVGGTAYGIKTNADKKALAESESISVSIEQSISESVIASEKAASELAEKLSNENATTTTTPTTKKDNDLEGRIEALEKERKEQESKRAAYESEIAAENKRYEDNKITYNPNDGPEAKSDAIERAAKAYSEHQKKLQEIEEKYGY